MTNIATRYFKYRYDDETSSQQRSTFADFQWRERQLEELDEEIEEQWFKDHEFFENDAYDLYKSSGPPMYMWRNGKCFRRKSSQKSTARRHSKRRTKRTKDWPDFYFTKSADSDSDLDSDFELGLL